MFKRETGRTPRAHKREMRLEPLRSS
jgi:hypothetical protein